jgi:hypothetical protein
MPQITDADLTRLRTAYDTIGAILLGTTPDQPPTPRPDQPTIRVPADLIDLSCWKLTLPTGKAQEIQQPGLATYTDPNFGLAPTGDAVRLTAPCGGGTTSGSSYPRCEFREMTAKGALAAWSTSSGTHTMSIRQRITHLPVVKPHLVAGQIHDANDDVVMVRLEGTRLFIESGGDEVALLDAAYNLGTAFTVDVTATGGYIDVAYNGTRKMHKAYKRTGCYFKAGCYVQSNTSKGDAATAYGQVEILALTVTHS